MSDAHAISIKTEFKNEYGYNKFPVTSHSPLNSPLTPHSSGINAISNPSRTTTHAEKRANHNAIERARRESLNIRFLELAQSIPSLVHVRKPSKSIIVSRSIEFINETKQRLEVKTRSLGLLRQQNEEFKSEINRLRSKLGMGSVVFPDNIDLDLVFEANLEHQKEMENRNPSSLGYSTFRNGSPFDMINTNLDSDDERRGPYSASVLSPLTIGERDESYRPQSAGASPLSTSLNEVKTFYGFPNQSNYQNPMVMNLGQDYGYNGFMAGSWEGPQQGQQFM